MRKLLFLALYFFSVLFYFGVKIHFFLLQLIVFEKDNSVVAVDPFLGIQKTPDRVLKSYRVFFWLLQ